MIVLASKSGGVVEPTFSVESGVGAFLDKCLYGLLVTTRAIKSMARMEKSVIVPNWNKIPASTRFIRVYPFGAKGE